MFLVDQQRVRLQYKGSERIVVATGIKRETLDEVVADWTYKNKKPLRTKASGFKYTMEASTAIEAETLKKILREKKKRFDLNGDQSYKADPSVKIRIIIESQDFYTLLLDHVF